jgi:cardiolipin synthase A/B
MQLLIQPGDGIGPLVKGIDQARTSVDILIFRFDRAEIEAALVNAVKRGVSVHALIAHTNRGGESRLRALEMRLLGAGVTVSRTASDLIRYHGKMMIVDGRELYLMAFNFTRLDIETSRSFALITTENSIVQEAIRLFEADSRRLPYTPELDNFIVSPANSRKQLSDFIKGAEKRLSIYDPAVTDPAIGRLVEERTEAGVEVRLLGKLSKKLAGPFEVHPLFMRLHTRMMIRDDRDVFLGSQSLRTAELDERREIGLIFRDAKIASRLTEIFEDDWRRSQSGKVEVAEDTEAEDDPPQVDSVARKVAKTIVRSLPPVTPVVEVVVRELIGARTDVELDARELEATVKDAVKSAVKAAVAVVVEQAAEQK